MGSSHVSNIHRLYSWFVYILNCEPAWSAHSCSADLTTLCLQQNDSHFSTLEQLPHTAHELLKTWWKVLVIIVAAFHMNITNTENWWNVHCFKHYHTWLHKLCSNLQTICYHFTVCLSTVLLFVITRTRDRHISRPTGQSLQRELW